MPSGKPFCYVGTGVLDGPFGDGRQCESGPSRTPVLDDNLNADLTAKAAGMQVCGVYDDSSKDSAEQIKAIADFYIYDFQELLHLETDKKA